LADCHQKQIQNPLNVDARESEVVDDPVLGRSIQLYPTSGRHLHLLGAGSTLRVLAHLSFISLEKVGGSVPGGVE
jgi:hypothetical protein